MSLDGKGLPGKALKKGGAWVSSWKQEEWKWMKADMVIYSRDRVLMDNCKATTPGLIRVFPVYMCNSPFTRAPLCILMSQLGSRRIVGAVLFYVIFNFSHIPLNTSNPPQHQTSSAFGFEDFAKSFIFSKIESNTLFLWAALARTEDWWSHQLDGLVWYCSIRAHPGILLVLDSHKMTCIIRSRDIVTPGENHQELGECWLFVIPSFVGLEY